MFSCKVDCPSHPFLQMMFEFKFSSPTPMDIIENYEFKLITLSIYTISLVGFEICSLF